MTSDVQDAATGRPRSSARSTSGDLGGCSVALSAGVYEAYIADPSLMVMLVVCRQSGMPAVEQWPRAGAAVAQLCIADASSAPASLGGNRYEYGGCADEMYTDNTAGAFVPRSTAPPERTVYEVYVRRRPRIQVQRPPMHLACVPLSACIRVMPILWLGVAHD